MAGSGCWTRQDIPADPAIQQQNNLAALSADIKTHQRKLSEVNLHLHFWYFKISWE